MAQTAALTHPPTTYFTCCLEQLFKHISQLQMNTFPSCVSLVQPLPWLRLKAPKFLFICLVVAQMEPTDDQMNTDVLGT